MKLSWRRERPPGPARRDPAAEPPPSQPDQVFTVLEARGVRYVTIGGLAVQAHGHARTTRDVDVLADPSPDNIQRLAAALKDLDAQLLGVDAHLLGIDPTDPTDLANGGSFTLTTDAGRVDVFTDPEYLGADTWTAIDKRAIEVDVGGLAPIRIVGLDDLLQMKRHAGRDRDLSDIAALTQRERPEPTVDPGPEPPAHEIPGSEIEPPAPPASGDVDLDP